MTPARAIADLKRLAVAEGVEATDAAALRRMDLKRKKKTSNEEWTIKGRCPWTTESSDRRWAVLMECIIKTKAAMVLESIKPLPKGQPLAYSDARRQEK